MAKIWAAVSCETGTIRGVHCRCRGPWARPSAVPPVEFSQCATRERNLGQVVPELGWEVRRLVEPAPRLDLLVRTVLLREVVCAGSLSIFRARHEQLLHNLETEGNPCGYSGRARGPGLSWPAGPQLVCVAWE